MHDSAKKIIDAIETENSFQNNCSEFRRERRKGYQYTGINQGHQPAIKQPTGYRCASMILSWRTCISIVTCNKSLFTTNNVWNLLITVE